MPVTVELIPKDMDKPADKPSEKAAGESGSKKSQIEAALGALRKRKEDAPKETPKKDDGEDKKGVMKFDSKMLSAARQLLLDKGKTWDRKGGKA
jgi:hypothetical protein